MKAPDKIYLYAKHPEPYWFGERQLNNDIEYIRKDALLEKLEKVAASYKKRSDEGELVWQNMCGINEAIEILNSM